MRTYLAVLLSTATACTLVVAGSTGPARAVGSLPTPPAPLPTVSVPVPGLPVVTAPAPTPALPGATPGPPAPGSEEAAPGGAGSSTGSTGSGPTPRDAGSAVAAGPSAATPAARRRQQRADATTPMLAGTAGAADLVDDEDSPRLSAASRAFLAADEGIAEIARQRRVLADLRQTATAMARVYGAIGLDITTAEGVSTAMHERYDEVLGGWADSARDAYMTGRSGTDDGTVAAVVAALTRFGDGGARAELRVGSLVVRRAGARAELEQAAALYDASRQQLDDATERGAALAGQRSTALQAVRAAKGSDIALHRARLVESGELGAQVRAASAALELGGSTVQGTGDLARPLEGQVTSPFGMRFHPILHYTKLHTGTDFAGASSILAADDGRVLMTVVSTAYGNLTVIDHGVVHGKRITTVYAHQATFLVHEGQSVMKGDRIGVVGSTGYATGPHLHFEVREDGTVVDPERRI